MDASTRRKWTYPQPTVEMRLPCTYSASTCKAAISGIPYYCRSRARALPGPPWVEPAGQAKPCFTLRLLVASSCASAALSKRRRWARESKKAAWQHVSNPACHRNLGSRGAGPLCALQLGHFSPDNRLMLAHFSAGRGREGRCVLRVPCAAATRADGFTQALLAAWSLESGGVRSLWSCTPARRRWSSTDRLLLCGGQLPCLAANGCRGN